MVDGGFQEESEARAKYDRARLSSTQLSTYFAGSLEMWDIEREVRRRAAAASGDPRGPDAVPEPRVVGGFGETPGFDYRRPSRIGRSRTARRRPRSCAASSSDEPGGSSAADGPGRDARAPRPPPRRSRRDAPRGPRGSHAIALRREREGVRVSIADRPGGLRGRTASSTTGFAGHDRLVERLDGLDRIRRAVEIGWHGRIGQLLPKVGDATPRPGGVSEGRVVERRSRPRRATRRTARADGRPTPRRRRRRARPDRAASRTGRDRRRRPAARPWRCARRS